MKSTYLSGHLWEYTATQKALWFEERWCNLSMRHECVLP